MRINRNKVAHLQSRQLYCGKQFDHEGNFSTNSVLAQGVNSPRTTDVTRTARSPRGQICTANTSRKELHTEVRFD